MRERVGLLELSGFPKFEVEGVGARAWLDGMVANTIPKKVGRTSLCYALTLRVRCTLSSPSLA